MTSAPPRSDISEYIAFMRRIMRAASLRVADADPDQLVELLELRQDLDVAIQRAVDGLRRGGATWQDIADATGVSRQAAHQRWHSCSEHGS